MPSRKKVSGNYFYFAKVTFQNGSVKLLRFSNKNLRRSAVAEYKRKYFVKTVDLSEGAES